MRAAVLLCFALIAPAAASDALRLDEQMTLATWLEKLSDEFGFVFLIAPGTTRLDQKFGTTGGDLRKFPVERVIPAVLAFYEVSASSFAPGAFFVFDSPSTTGFHKTRPRWNHELQVRLAGTSLRFLVEVRGPSLHRVTNVRSTRRTWREIALGKFPKRLREALPPTTSIDKYLLTLLHGTTFPLALP